MEIWGIRWVGLTPENGQKLLLTVGFIIAVLLLRLVVRAIVRVVLDPQRNPRPRFWTRQVASLAVAALPVGGVIST